MLRCHYSLTEFASFWWEWNCRWKTERRRQRWMFWYVRWIKCVFDFLEFHIEILSFDANSIVCVYTKPIHNKCAHSFQHLSIFFFVSYIKCQRTYSFLIKMLIYIKRGENQGRRGDPFPVKESGQLWWYVRKVVCQPFICSDCTNNDTYIQLLSVRRFHQNYFDYFLFFFFTFCFLQIRAIIFIVNGQVVHFLFWNRVINVVFGWFINVKIMVHIEMFHSQQM